MTKQKKDKYSNVSTLKKVVVVIGLFGTLFGGMFAGIVAVNNYKNYIHPYGFTLLCGTIGLVVGLYITKLIKPYIILNKTMLFNYSQLTLMFSMGTIGMFMLLGYYLNSAISTQTKCDEFTVVNIEYVKGGYKYSEQNIIYVDVERITEKFLCRHNYWKSISIGQKVKVCIYKSPIGFDNLVLPEDN